MTVAGRATAIPRYVDALLAEMRLRPAPGRLRTISFGGGTPSLLPPLAVARLVQAAIDRWANRINLAEVSLEANPSAHERPDWTGLRAAGVTRLSLGVQSLRDADLVALARGHSAAEAREAYLGARAAGFASVSVDLIYGIPGQSLAAWRGGLRAALDLEPDHLSLYALQLSLEPDEWAAPPRPGALRWRRRMVGRQDDEVAAAQYELAEEMLAAAGYRHYELSSWARPGHESVHNQAYWQRRAYTGLGAGAHSWDGSVRRSWNERSLDRYLARVESGERPLAGAEDLDEPTRAFEAVALGLRLVDGVDRRGYEAEFGRDPATRYRDAVDDTSRAGLLEVTPRRLRFTARGRLLASEALVAFAP